jgi:hypothetical protein
MVENLESLTDLAQDFVDELVFDRNNQDNQRSLSVFNKDAKESKADNGRGSILSNKDKGPAFKKQSTVVSFSNRRERKNFK